MLKSSSKRHCSILVIVAFFFMIIGWPYDSNADVTKWPRKDLPRSFWAEPLVIAALAAVVVIVVITSVGKKKESKDDKDKDKNKKEQKEDAENDRQAVIFDFTQSSYANYQGLINSEPDGVSLSFYLGVSNNDFNDIDTKRFDFNLSNQAVVVGVRLNL